MKAQTRMIVIAGAVCAFFAISLANFLHYAYQLQVWNDAALKGPGSVAWPGSVAALIAQHEAIERGHFYVEVALVLLVVAAIVTTIVWKPMPRGVPADTRA
jgi:hypothetical protein